VRPWWELGGYYGSGDFYNGQASHGELMMFAPVTQSLRDLLFVEARGKLYEATLASAISRSATAR
jgi:hypothetical protein